MKMDLQILILENQLYAIKIVPELNTHLEQRDFFKDIFAMDRIADNALHCICPKMRERTFFPEKWDFYGSFPNNCC